MPVNYKFGKIYKLVSDKTDKIYIGSTAKNLSARFQQHVRNFIYWLNGTYHYTTAFDMFEFENVKIILLENYPCNNKNELQTREQFYADKFKNICVNFYNAVGYDKKKVLKNNKKYRQSDKFKAWLKKYRQSDKFKKYRQSDKHKAYMKEYGKHYINKKANQKFHCKYCDIYALKHHEKRHYGTQKHKKNVEFIQSVFDDLN